jgi:hypothetical protein
MKQRHKGLWENPEGIPAAGDAACEALAAIKDVADQHLASLRCDRLERHRQMQVDGTTGLQFEDLFAMAMKNDHGRDAVLAGLRVLLAKIGYDAVPTQVSAEDVHEALAVVSECASAVEAETIRALRDNDMNETEAALVAKKTRRLEAATATLRASAMGSLMARAS